MENAPENEPGKKYENFSNPNLPVKKRFPFFYFVYIILGIFVILLAGAGFYFYKKNPKTEPETEWEKLKTLIWEKPKTAVPWQARDSQTEYVWNNRLFILGGLNANQAKTNSTTVVYEKAIYFNDIWYTEDGENWIMAKEHASFPPIRSASIVPFKGELWMLGGFSPDSQINYKVGIWKSADGVEWSQVKKDVPFPPREGFRSLEINGKICFFGGVNYFIKEIYNDVWCSPDGLNWSAQTLRAPWEGRWDYDAVYYHGVIYLAGGMNLKNEGWNDIWISKDEGASWELLSEHAPWSVRQGQVMLIWKDLIWLIGGLEPKTNTGVGDTWFTSDGINWTKTKTDGPWRGREDHGVAVWKDSLWLVGGMDDQWNWKEGVWHTPVPTNTSK